MAGIFRKLEEKVHLEKTEGGKLHKEEMVHFEEKGGRHHKEESVHLKEELVGNEAGGYPHRLEGNEAHESGLMKKIKQKMYKKKEKIGRKGAGDDGSSSSSDSD